MFLEWINVNKAVSNLSTGYLNCGPKFDSARDLNAELSNDYFYFSTELGYNKA